MSDVTTAPLTGFAAGALPLRDAAKATGLSFNWLRLQCRDRTIAYTKRGRQFVLTPEQQRAAVEYAHACLTVDTALAAENARRVNGRRPGPKRKAA